MTESVLSNEKECYVCGNVYNLHRHHIFFGTANRKQSEKYGCWVYLCAHHHNFSKVGVHHNRNLDLKLKRECQAKLEKDGWTREEFIKVFGRNYID